MYIHLLNNKFNKLALLCSVSLLFAFIGNAQQKWEGLNIGNIGPYAYFTRIATDLAENKLVLGSTGYLTQIDGVSTCPLIKWTPENGVEILSPFDPNIFSVSLVLDILPIPDSLIIVGNKGISIYSGGQWVYNLRNSDISFNEIIKYKDSYLLTFNNNMFNFYGEPIKYLLEWYGDTTFTEFENISQQIISGAGVFAVAEYQGDVYVAGNIRNNQGGLMNNVMMWDGDNWDDMDGGITNTANLGGASILQEYNGDLYVAGQFYQNDHSKENLIARWDGQNWKTVGGGFDSGTGPGTEVIYAMHVYDGYLYVSGKFNTAGGVPVNSIARWDGNEWCGNSSTFDGPITSMTHYRDTLYVSGAFRHIDGDSARSVARFIGDNFADTCGSLSVAIQGLLLEPVFLEGYPNPAISNFTINLPLSKTEKVKLVVYNNLGQVVISNQYFTTDSQISFDVSSLSKGSYIGRVMSEEKMFIVKFVKE